MISDYRKNELFFAPVYNYGYYRERNKDVEQILGDNRKKYLRHFLLHGMREGRIASPGFNVNVYRDANPDLRQKYGENLKEYYYHYLFWGFSEPRKTY